MIEKIGLNQGQYKIIRPKQFDNKQEKKDLAIKNHFIAPFNNSYTTAFLGKKDYNQDEREFYKFRKRLAEYDHKKDVYYQKIRWETLTGTKENIPPYKDIDRIISTYDIQKTLKEFNESNINDEELKKSLQNYIREYSSPSLGIQPPERIKELEKRIKINLNKYNPAINDKKYTRPNSEETPRAKTKSELVKNIYRTTLQTRGDLIADDLVRLIKARNKYARDLGYKNYYDYKISYDYGWNEKDIKKLAEEIEIRTRNVYNENIKNRDKTIAESYNIKQNEIQPWHYYYKENSDLTNAIEERIEEYGGVKNLAQSIFEEMGWDIKALPIQMDIYPRPGKQKYGSYSVNVEKNKDTRIFTNIKDNIEGLNSLNHELGHAFYELGISDRIPYDRRNFPSFAMTETIALLCSFAPNIEEALKEPLDLSENKSKKHKKDQTESEIDQIRNIIAICDFESQMYENPDQDLSKLWYKIQNKYLGKQMPEKFDNAWATVPHFLTNPAYYPNYLKAELMAAQIYETAYEKLGPLTQNKNTAGFFNKKVFRHGNNFSDEELLKKITGKELSCDSFINLFATEG